MTQKYLLGFDIGGTQRAAILGAIRDGREPDPLSRTQFATRECATPGECIEKLCRLGLEALRQAGLRPGDLHGVGISIYPASISSLIRDKDVCVRPVEHPNAHADYALIWNKNHTLSHVADEFINYVESIEERNSVE